MGRPGRKRNIDRTPVDKRDYGTVELQLHRAEAVGAKVLKATNEGVSGRVIVSGDPTLARSELGKLRAKEEIDQQQFEAGEKYQAMCWAVWSKPFVRAFDWTGLLGEYDGDRDRIRHDLARLDRGLKAESRATLDAVRNITQYDRPPSFLHLVGTRRTHDRKRLIVGLEELAVIFGYKKMRTV